MRCSEHAPRSRPLLHTAYAPCRFSAVPAPVARVAELEVVRRFRALARVEFTGHPPHMTPQLKIVVEKHSDGYVAYPLGLARGAVVGQGDTYEAALSDVRSAIAFHVETFGAAALASAEDDPVLEAFVAETAVPA